MRIPAPALGSLFLVWAVTSRPLPASSPGSLSEDSDPYSSCRGSEKADACDRVEARLLTRRKGRVERSGRQLRLIPSHGSPVVLTDDPDAEEQYVRYRYRAYLSSIGQHLIDVTSYEVRGFSLVDARTGQLTKLQAVPVISPDLRRFVTASLDLEVGTGWNAVQIWRLTEAGPKLEFSLDGRQAWGPSDPVWRDARTIEFRKNVVTSDPDRLAQSRVVLALGPSGWTVREPASVPVDAPPPRTPSALEPSPRAGGASGVPGGRHGASLAAGC